MYIWKFSHLKTVRKTIQEVPARRRSSSPRFVVYSDGSVANPPKSMYIQRNWNVGIIVFLKSFEVSPQL